MFFPLKHGYFTLSQFSGHLLNEAVKADADFQLRQRQALQQVSLMPYSDVMMPEMLKMGELSFSFCISHHPLPRLKRFFMKLIYKNVPPENGFRLTGKGEPADVTVTISIYRDKLNRLQSAIKTDPPMQTKPEESYVTGIAI